MNDLQGVRTVQSQAAQYVADVQALMNDLPVAAVPAVVEALLGAWRGGHPVFVCGNGGSAATASHFVNDLNKGTNVAGKRRFRALGLVDNTALLMAWSNDTAYEYALAEQVVNFVEPGAVLVAISGSGNSPNVLRAVEVAQAHGAITVGITGFDGGKLQPLADLGLHVPSRCMEQVEDAHMILCHTLTVTLRRAIAAEPDLAVNAAPAMIGVQPLKPSRNGAVA
ncbi:MAG: SIS domain-containing protein [Anaerolineae bacterium]|nr:SIS domain-containing protein [Anaerolineae bacterium]